MRCWVAWVPVNSHYSMRESSGSQDGFVELVPSEASLHSSVIFSWLSSFLQELCADLLTPSTPCLYVKELKRPEMRQVGRKQTPGQIEFGPQHQTCFAFPEPATSCNRPHRQHASVSQRSQQICSSFTGAAKARSKSEGRQD